MFANFFANRHAVTLLIGLLLPNFHVYALPPGPFVLKEELTIHTIKFDSNGNLLWAVRPSVVDLDNDGDFDLVSGSSKGSIMYFENIGNRTTPQFIQRHGEDNHFYGINVDPYSAPTLLDLDGDGDFDLAIGVRPGVFVYFENIGSPNSPLFVERTGTDNPLENIDVTSIDTVYVPSGVIPILTVLDIDNDGDLDLIVTSTNPYQTIFTYFENIGNQTTPQFIHLKEVDNLLNGLVSNDPSDTPSISALDFNHDNNIDLVLSDEYILLFAENIGNPAELAFVFHAPTPNPWPEWGTPVWVDLDGDNDLDAVVMNPERNILFYENKNLKDYERVLNWVESILPYLFPFPAVTLELPPFKVRFYPATDIYLGYNTEDGHVYLFVPPHTELTDLGPLEIYFEAVHTAGF